MIPPLNDDGFLPAGIHQATIEEVAERFGSASELRQAQMDSLCWMVDLAWKAGVVRIIVNGSFTTDKLEPNDVDCALMIDADFPRDAAAEAELLSGLPFINVELVDEAGLNQMTRFYGTSRRNIPKGLVEIIT